MLDIKLSENKQKLKPLHQNYDFCSKQYLDCRVSVVIIFTTGNLYGLRRLCRDLCLETEPTQMLPEIPRPKYLKYKNAIFVSD